MTKWNYFFEMNSVEFLNMMSYKKARDKFETDRRK